MSDERNIWGELEHIKNLLGDISEAPTVIGALTDVGTQLEELINEIKTKNCLKILELELRIQQGDETAIELIGKRLEKFMEIYELDDIYA